jgi:hypothetical protein
VCVFASKLSKAIYYRDAEIAFPNHGCLLLNWFTNAELLRDGRYAVLDIFKELGGSSPPLQRGGKYLNDQFEYKLSMSNENDTFVLQAFFGKAFGVLVFGCAVPGRLESSIDRLRKESGKGGPFVILQSSLMTSAAAG